MKFTALHSGEAIRVDYEAQGVPHAFTVARIQTDMERGERLSEYVARHGGATPTREYLLTCFLASQAEKEVSANFDHVAEAYVTTDEDTLKPRSIRLNDVDWKYLTVLGGADYLRSHLQHVRRDEIRKLKEARELDNIIGGV